MFLVDTSVWIDFLRGRDTKQAQFLKILLEEGEACICEVTYAEICFGAKDKKQLKKYAEYFGALPFLSLPTNWYVQVADLGWKLRMAGFSPFLADLMIALISMENKANLLTTDSDFAPFAELFGLKIEGLV